MNIKRLAMACGMTLILASPAMAARDYVSIVGSSTVYPFATVVAEQFGKASGNKTPKVESTGTGGGFKLFCGGIGVDFPDITNASRAIKPSELKNCADNGVQEIVEVKIGYDGIVVANAKTAKQLELSRKDLFLALAKNVPDPKNPEKLIANPYMNWNEVKETLPATAIEVLGPPPTSGTRDAFVELVMEKGCEAFDALQDLKKSDEKAHGNVCRSIRQDGAYIEAGENDNLIVQKLQANPRAVGIFGFSFLDQNSDTLQGAKIDGQLPVFAAIADGSYKLSRPIFFYIKKAHVEMIPGIKGYIAEFASEKAWGPEGYLADKGLIPMPDAERKRVAADVAALKPMAMK